MIDKRFSTEEYTADTCDIHFESVSHGRGLCFYIEASSDKIRYFWIVWVYALPNYSRIAYEMCFTYKEAIKFLRRLGFI